MILRNKYELGPTSTLIGLKNSTGDLQWSNGVPFNDNTSVFWIDSYKNYLPKDKCVHASLCNNSNPLRWHVADCDSLAPFLCQAQRCPSIWNLLNVNLSHIEPEHLFVKGSIKLPCNEKHSVERTSRFQTLSCNQGGVWNKTPKNCILHNCTNFPNVPNSFRNVTSGSFHLDAEVEYVCKPGYALHKKDEGFIFKERCTLKGWEWYDGPRAVCDGYYLNIFYLIKISIFFYHRKHLL